MTISRRLFLKAASGATLVATIPQAFVNAFGQDKRKPVPGAPDSTGARGIPLIGNLDPLYYYNSATFSSYVGSTFRVYLSQRRYVDLRLAEVNELKPAVPGKDGFALVFEDSVANRLSSALYKIEHSALGTISMMLCPVSRKRTTYEAVFNRQYS